MIGLDHRTARTAQKRLPFTRRPEQLQETAARFPETSTPPRIKKFFYLLDNPYGTVIKSGNTPDQLISNIHITPGGVIAPSGGRPGRLFPTTGNGQMPCLPRRFYGFLPFS
jgi:hypothetical protein